jgi:predicted metal-dependent hydrolase
LEPEKVLQVRTPSVYTLTDMLKYEEYIVSSQEWIRRVQQKYQKRGISSHESQNEAFPEVPLSHPDTTMPSGEFVSHFHSIAVPDPKNKGRIARQIPKSSLPLLSRDLVYVIVPNVRRKNFSLVLKDGKDLEIRTPLSYTSADMHTYEEYIVSCQEWLLHADQKYKNKENISPESLDMTFPDRNYILYLGVKYPFYIQITTVSKAAVTFEQDHFEIRTSSTNSEELCAALSDWYLKRVEEILPPLVEKYAAIMNLPVPDLMYNCIKSRWGLCYPLKNKLKFNALILKTPPDCIEYLVVHELSHFYVSGHGKKYWMIVSYYMPDYEIRRKKFGTYRTVL